MKLTARHLEKPWGRVSLPAPFAKLGSEKIGEVWFEAETGPALPLMVKYLFTSEKLSIQVHPNDVQARRLGLPSGKEECWLVLDAEPDARLGIGTKRALTSDALRGAATCGEIEALMDWKPVRRGDFFYIPAGTVHAIGAGVSLIEIQQNADITYRLYDYGRPRELHLDDGVAVSRAQPYAEDLHKWVDFNIDQTLLDGPLFRVRLCGAHENLPGTGPLIVVPVQGSVTASYGGEADYESFDVAAGECLAIDSATRFDATPDARLLMARAV